jgi:Ca-activated chloride channel family protein
MNQAPTQSCPQPTRAGAMLPIIAVVMVILFVAAVLSIDIARIHVTRSELRTATDAAARAAVEALGREQSQSAAIDAAKRVANQNIVAGRGLTLANENIVFGTSLQHEDGSFSFSESGSPINSVRVVGARTAASPDGPVGLMFGPMFGVTDFSPVQTAVATRTDRDIALVLDVSGSMGSYGRFDALKNALRFFLIELDDSPQDERVSLTVYSTFSRKRVDLTSDLDSIRTAFAEESPGGRTGIGRGMRTGLDSILNDAQSRNFALKSIVVMTDGRWNEGVNPTTVARECADENVEVHTITFSQGANQTLMADVATIANGTHLHADTDEQLIEAFETIARQLQVLLIE